MESFKDVDFSYMAGLPKHWYLANILHNNR
jgi:hypothetical protein